MDSIDSMDSMDEGYDMEPMKAETVGGPCPWG